MNLTLFLCGLILAATAALHEAIGYGHAMRALRAETLPRLARTVSDLVWRGVTVTLACLSGAFLWMAWHPNPALLVFACAIQTGFGALFLWYGVTRLGSPWKMPQWIIFLGVPALAAWGG